MTDCDLCGRGIPTVIPVRVPSPRFKFAYPEGVWRGLCERCLDSAEKTYQSIDVTELSCRRDKCTLCGRIGRVYLVEVQIPDFLEGVVKTERNVCDFCLEAIDKVYCRCGGKREREERER
jgi:F420H2 dehydrogenase subunit O